MTLGVLGVYALVVAIVVLHFSLLGAATGGVIGLVRDLFRRPHLARTLNPEP